MNTCLDCIPCFLKQALFAARAAATDERKAKEVLDRVAELVSNIPLDNPPPETARLVYAAVREITQVEDPFRDYKERSIEKALSLYGELKSMVNGSKDPLLAAVKIAIGGNVIDAGAIPDFNLGEETRNLFRDDLPESHYGRFKHCLENAGIILYLADNAGETVFDRVLIETMGKETVYTVRDIPIINDATIEDARKSGIGEMILRDGRL